MYVIKREEFDDIASMILKEYSPDTLRYPRPLDIEQLATEGFYLDIQYAGLSPEGDILGMIAFGDVEVEIFDFNCQVKKMNIKEGTILLDYSLMGDKCYARRRFTLAHEVAHWICHRAYHSPIDQEYEFRLNREALEKRVVGFLACRSSNIEQIDRNMKKRSDNEWEEWQADSLAAALLMPRDQFKEEFANAMKREGITRGCLMEDENTSSIRRVVKDLARTFLVSYKATRIRLYQCGMIVRKNNA